MDSQADAVSTTFERLRTPGRSLFPLETQLKAKLALERAEVEGSDLVVPEAVTSLRSLRAEIARILVPDVWAAADASLKLVDEVLAVLARRKVP